MQIRQARGDELEAIVEVSLLAWAPVFDSFERVLGTEIYRLLYPDWQTSQRATVETYCRIDGPCSVWVADIDAAVVGFVAYELNQKEKVGEVQLLAVHPDYQNRGIGTALNTFALDKMHESGMTMAVVGTGGDPGHAPARTSYEKSGYTPLPLVRYYKKL